MVPCCAAMIIMLAAQFIYGMLSGAIKIRDVFRVPEIVKWVVCTGIGIIFSHALISMAYIISLKEYVIAPMIVAVIGLPLAPFIEKLY